MGKQFVYILIFLTTTASIANGQIPVIQKIEPTNTFPQERILISGNGFNSNPSLLQVWFDQVQGTIIQSSDFSIEVAVPAQARFSTIEVINLTSKLSTKSIVKFMPSYSGEPFDPAKFASPLTFTSTQELWDICSCDLNNDAKPDIISTKFYGPATDLMVLQNQSTPGILSFLKLDKVNLPALNLTTPTDNVVCGDLQGDGKPDLVVTQSGSPRNSILILRNTSAGVISFATPVKLLLDVDHLATRSVIRDLNADGKPEILVTNSFNNEIYIFINQSSAGTLSFNPTPLKLAVTGAATTYGIDVQDLNGDKLPDIVVNQFQTSDVFILKNNSTGSISFGAAQKIPVGGTLNKIVTADINKDGLLDLVITNTISNQLVILLNKSTAAGFSFPSTLAVPTGNGPWGIDVSDIDGDSDPDLIVANRNQQQITVLLHEGNYTIPSFTRKDVTTAKPSRNILAGDLDGDAKPDIAFTSFNTATSSYSLDILRNKNCHQPKILNDEPVVICTGQTIRLKTIALSGITYTWREGAGIIKTGTDPFVDIITPGTFTVTASSEGGTCALASPSITVTSSAGSAPSDPVITTNAPLCVGANLQLSTPLVSGGTYSWTGPNGFTSSLQNPVINNVNSTHAGNYYLIVSVGSCSSNEKSVHVDVADLASFAITSNSPTNTVCQGNSVTLSVSNSPDYTYQWMKDGVNIVGQTSYSTAANQDGQYKVKVGITSLSCSVESEPVTVTVLQPPVAAYTADVTACTNETITFTNESQVDTRATALYAWNFGDTQTSNAASPTHAYTTAQTYTASLTVSYNGTTGCTNNTSKLITITAGTLPTITATKSSLCPGEDNSLSVSGTFTSITWSTTATTSSIVVNQPGTYSVNTTDSNECPGTDDIVIESKEIPVLIVSAEETSLSSGEQTQLNVSGADTYLWSPSESLSDASISNPIATPATTTTYSVTGTITGACSATGEITITVDESSVNIKVPPAFSPNGDGPNDALVIEGVENYSDCTLNVFDGRGRRVFQQTGYNNDWNGTYQGKPVPDGTYYYVFGCPTGKTNTGSILIFR